MFQCAKLLKHKILIGLLYGCGLRCIEARSVRLQDLDFDRKQLKVVQGRKERPLCTTFNSFNPSITKNTSKPKTPRLPFQRPAFS
jgi:integrase